jgi:hypothetical protein
MKKILMIGLFTNLLDGNSWTCNALNRNHGSESTKSWSWQWAASIGCVSTNRRDEMPRGRSSPRRMRYEVNQGNYEN